MKKALAVLFILALVLGMMPAYADDSTTADLFRYVPTCITVNGYEAKVEGYFVNLSSKTLLNIRELELTIYRRGEVYIESGSFSGDNLLNFELAPYSVIKWTFTYTNGGRYIADGVQVVGSGVYADFSCKFSSRS